MARVIGCIVGPVANGNGAVLHECLPCDTHGPFPRETIRDLLGITRALYRAERAAALPDGRERLDRLTEIGKHYRLALELALKCGPGTMGRRAAWAWAEKATEALGDFVAESAELASVVRASAQKLSR